MKTLVSDISDLFRNPPSLKVLTGAAIFLWTGAFAVIWGAEDSRQTGQVSLRVKFFRETDIIFKAVDPEKFYNTLRAHYFFAIMLFILGFIAIFLMVKRVRRNRL